jgi:hypothetical protein
MTVTALPWYIARSAGLVGWALLTASVIWGLVISTKASARGRRPRPAWTLDLHRYLGGLGTVFTGVHVGAILIDTYVPFSLTDALVPFASSWRPGAVAWGVVSLYLLLAIELTSLARKRLPRRAWRAIHFAAFPLFAMSTMHAITAGTDGRTWGFMLAVASASAVIGALTAHRIWQAGREPARPPKPPSTDVGRGGWRPIPMPSGPPVAGQVRTPFGQLERVPVRVGR